MKTNKELRLEAFSNLTGNWTNPVLATLIYFLIGGGLNAVSISTKDPLAVASISSVNTLWSIFIVAPIAFGLQIALLKFFRGDKENTIQKMFDVFHYYGKVLGVVLLNLLYIFLWMLLLIIPGIIKAYSYAMSYYILNDNPEIGAEEAICRSMEMMRGNKWKLFCLDLSFIGWFLLGILTLGIGLLWVEPYWLTARAAFYEEVKGTVTFVEE